MPFASQQGLQGLGGSRFSIAAHTTGLQGMRSSAQEPGSCRTGRYALCVVAVLRRGTAAAHPTVRQASSPDHAVLRSPLVQDEAPQLVNPLILGFVQRCSS